MKVAWQFTAWNAFTKRPVPGHGLSWFFWQVHHSRLRNVPSDPIISAAAETGSVSCIPWQ